MKSKKTELISLLFIVTVMLFASCKKEGTGGKSTIKGIVKHHSTIIANAIVYIKYGAKDFPGADVSNYDANVTCDANGNYEIKELRKGDYYLYGVGYDSAISANVYGGLSAKLRNNESKNVDIAVVE